MIPYQMSEEEIYRQYQTSKDGLASDEAKKRLTENGPNRLREGRRVTLWQRFFSQLTDPMVLILIGAAVISAVTSAMAKEPFTDVFLILFVVTLNTVLGVLQESKAEKAIDALKQMTAATSKVLRDGKIQTLHSEELVVGDIVMLETGDAVPADGRFLSCICLKTEEAALTGESVPTEKTSRLLKAEDSAVIPLGDRHNMGFMGSHVAAGRGVMAVTAVGMATEMGSIAEALAAAEDEETPLQKRLSALSRFLTGLVLGICLFMFLLGMLRIRRFDPSAFLDTFMLAVSLAVAAIPEGLAAVVTIVLSIGVTRMSKHNAIIRRLTAVETLGCTQTICTDKTGTLTQNRMTIVETVTDSEKLLASSLTLCSDAHLLSDGTSEGDPTEAAGVLYAARLGLRQEELNRKWQRIGEIPFDSERKRMTTFHKRPGSSGFVQHTKGAPDIMLSRCQSVLEDGKILPMTKEKRAFYLKENERLASKALRVLAAAFREYEEDPTLLDGEICENDLILIGLAGMIDPVRAEVPDAIRQCREAGIRPVMITGDHRDTAIAIAGQLGILRDPSQALTGAELDVMSDETLEKDVERYSVYARVKPEHKVRIVNAWKAHGCVTAMTGDGVNDAPSIKRADIGIGMGVNGTDVTKNVADMILADDNFATIVSAVGEGRRVYDNIRKSVQFLLSSNLSEVFSIFFATLFGFTILRPIHILFINLITDSLPALALGLEPAEPDLMKRKPRRAGEGIFAGGVGFSVFYQGLLVTLLTLAAYFLGHYTECGVWEVAESPAGVTMAFLTMSMCEIFHSCNMRAPSDSVFRLKKQNPLLLAAMGLSFALTGAVIFLPGLRGLFGFAAITLPQYVIAMLLAASVIPIVEMVKLAGGKRKP